MVEVALAQLSSATVVAAAAADVTAVADLSAEDAALATDDPSPPYAGLIVAIPPKGNACVIDTSFCVLVGSREALHGGMSGLDPRPHRCGKGGW